VSCGATQNCTCKMKQRNDTEERYFVITIVTSSVPVTSHDVDVGYEKSREKNGIDEKFTPALRLVPNLELTKATRCGDSL
jgi:hypothetical protein